MIINKTHVIFNMNKTNEPVAKCSSGDTVTFKTMDCFSDTIKSEQDLVSGIDFERVNPATGPLYVEGAEVGDVLKVKIKKITLDDKGVVITAPGLGRLKEQIEQEETIICPVNEDHVEFKGLRIPLRKMIGVIGVAPEGEGISTGNPHDHGGNLDCTEVTEGSILYFSVNTEGALLSLGDMHATMGDGEIMGSGLEIAGEAELEIEVLKDSTYKLPLIETEEKWITLGSRQSMEDASNVAINNMVDLIMQKTDLTFNQAGMLISLAGDLKACQVVNPHITMRVELSKAILESKQYY